MSFLQATQIQKRFGPVRALRGVDLRVEEGEIHALLGENGAGKTTLMNILFGLLSPDSGSIRLGGNPYSPTSPQEAMAAGVGMVHQHFMLVPTLTVLENILLGEKPFSRYRREEGEAGVTERMAELSFTLPLEKRVEELSVGERQRVEIFKALWKGARFLILDEPTAVLAPQEIGDLFHLLEDLGSKGHSILFISHKLEEIQSLCDRVTLLRRGESVGTFEVSAVDKTELTRLLLGHDLHPSVRNREEIAIDKPPFVLTPMRTERGRLQANWSCEVEPGRITAIAGIEGNGQRELAEAILGVSKSDRVSLRRGDRVLPPTSRDRIHSGVGLISEDRQRTGLVTDFTVAENLALKDVDSPPWSSRGWLDRKRTGETATLLVEQYGVSPAEPDQKVSNLSGGNQQKVVVAREISRDHELLVAFNPTRGLDVGACETVYEALIEDAESGSAILLISTELEEVQRLADRLYVLFEGDLVELPRQDWTTEKIGLAMLGEGGGGSS